MAQVTKNNRKNDVRFLNMAQFLSQTGHTNLELVHNEKSGKLSVLAEDGTFYKAQQDLDADKRMAWIMGKNDEITEACLINVSGDGSPLKTLATLVG